VTRLAASAIRLFVAELASATPFYRDALGLALLAAGEGYAVFDSGAIRRVVEEGDRDERGRPLAGRFSGLNFRTMDVLGEYARLQALGVALAGPPETQPWGGRLLTVEDPSGNELQLVQYPE
jgi:predicted enzyme related to lactoylglutathione lyase